MDYSLHDPLVLDVQTRRAQAIKILRVLEHFARAHGMTLEKEARCVDVGCSSGIITHALAERFAHVVGVDVDWHALALSQRGKEDGGGIDFAAASALALPLLNDSCDVAVCNQVYQYVADVPCLFAEIHRVLKADGFGYFSARNLWGIAANENRLPLIASRSPRVAHILESALRPEDNWRHRAGALWPYRKLRALAERYFIIYDYTVRVLRDPALAELFVPVRFRRWLNRAPRIALESLKALMPTHIWILQK